jgi:polyribonucleotide nucleotidyltransferase
MILRLNRSVLLQRRLARSTTRTGHARPSLSHSRLNSYHNNAATLNTIHQQNHLSGDFPQSYRQFSSQSEDKNDKAIERTTSKSQPFSNIIHGPPIQFGIDKIANLTERSVIGSSGQTVALVTMATAFLEENSSRSHSIVHHLRRRCQKASQKPLTVDYRQRHHAVGKIPTTANRSDNRRPTNAETLASRVIDRALRPLLQSSDESIHLTCSIQACPLEDGEGGYPVALALNSAAVALNDRLQEPIACVYLCWMKDGSVWVDPSMPNEEDAVGGLLYAGTREKIVMMEFSGMLPEAKLVDFIALAHRCIQPLLDTREKTALLAKKDHGDDMDDEALRVALGLPSNAEITTSGDNSEESELNEKKAMQIFDQAKELCSERLSEASLRVFGVTAGASSVDNNSGATMPRNPKIHSKDSHPLLTKSLRGRREHLFRQEIRKILQEFQPDDSTLTAEDYAVILQQGDAILNDMADTIHSELLKEAMKEAAIRHGSRADGRGGPGDGCLTIRPLSMEVPALPDVVHGSSIFTRGETQVLCTATLGPPKDGILLSDPYYQPKEVTGMEDGNKPFQDLPVGSLRYLKNQEHLESDLNSRKVRADREQTGDSGILKERQRAFLQYDFPAYSKGEVQTGSSMGANRREIGHGALAEKAVLPMLPSASEFPYAIRMTSEVTSSNGSSSMASVCGATLALLDAGVPITSPVAGVSVGLAKDEDNDESYQLLLDITGTEDYYGTMDFKIAGTISEVTALQLDVHQPLPLSIVADALNLAKDARRVILEEMKSQSAVSSSGRVSNLLPRSELKPSAPRVEVVRFDPTRKKDLLGPGGVVIRQMEDRFNVSLDLTQEGRCLLFGDDQEMVRKAKAAVMDLVADVEVGGVYDGTVIELRDFGAIIELLRNKEGLCHVSELAARDLIKAHPEGTVGLINSILQVGQKIEVVCMAVDPVQGTIRLKPVSGKKSSP